MRRLLIMLLCIALLGTFAGCRAKTAPEIETGSTVAQDQTAVTEEYIPTETDSDAQSPGTISSDSILEGIVRWAKTNLNLSDSKPYDMSALFGSDQAKALIRNHKAILFEDGSIVGYCSYAVPQSVKTTSSGDVVYGDGVDFVDSQIKAEADKNGKESYTNSGKDRVFFIISDKSRLNDLIGFYMNSSEGNCPAPEQSSYLGALSEGEKQKILEFAKGWYADNFPNYKDLVFEFAKDSAFGYTQYPQYKPGEIIILRVTSEKSFADSVRSCFIKITDSGYEVFNEGT